MVIFQPLPCGLSALPETLRITAHVADWTWPGAAVCCFLLLWISGHKRCRQGLSQIDSSTRLLVEAVPLVPCCFCPSLSFLCRLPDPQRTHVMWATSKVSSGRGVQQRAGQAGMEPASSEKGWPQPWELRLSGLRDVWAPLRHTVHRKPGCGHRCGFPLPLSWPQRPAAVPDGPAAP